MVVVCHIAVGDVAQLLLLKKEREGYSDGSPGCPLFDITHLLLVDTSLTATWPLCLV